MPKISDDKRAARRAQILEAAWVCFQKEGIHATTMDDIIKASGLSAGAVYSYYPGKEDLILAAVTTSLSGLQARVEPILRSKPPSPDLLARQIAEAIGEFTTHDTYDLKRIALLGWSEAQRNEPLRETMRQFYLVFLDQLTETAIGWRKAGLLQKRASARDVGKVVMAEILGFVVQSAIMGGIEPKDVARGLRDLMASNASDTP